VRLRAGAAIVYSVTSSLLERLPCFVEYRALAQASSRLIRRAPAGSLTLRPAPDRLTSDADQPGELLETHRQIGSPLFGCSHCGSNMTCLSIGPGATYRRVPRIGMVPVVWRCGRCLTEEQRAERVDSDVERICDVMARLGGGSSVPTGLN
jgi:hypothetical protein